MYSLKVRNEKLMGAIISLSCKSRFYFEMLTYCDFKEVEHSGFAMSIRIKRKGSFELAYNPAYIELWNESQIHFTLIHEIQHALSNHMQRAMLLSLELERANVANDMIINTNISEQFKLQRPTGELDGKVQDIGVFIPKEYEGERISEPLYDWLLQKYPPVKMKVMQIKIGNQKGESVDVFMDKNGNIYIDQEKVKEECGIKDEVSQEVKDSIIRDVIERCQARGLLSGSEQEQLDKIRRSKKNYLNEIKTVLSSMMGAAKSSSWKTFSRKYDLAPGYHRIKHEFNVILDVSGSMMGLFERALSYIFHHDIVVNLIQCDTEVQGFKQCIHLSDIQKIKIKGLGGTTLQPGIQYVIQHRHLSKLPLLLLTDGYCDSLDFDQLNQKALIISVGEKVPISGSKQVKQIVIAKE